MKLLVIIVLFGISYKAAEGCFSQSPSDGGDGIE